MEYTHGLRLVTAVLLPLNLTFHLQSSTNLIAPAVSRNPGARASHAVVNLNPAEHITSAGPNHKTQKNQDFLFRPPLRYYPPFPPRVKSAKCTRNLLADWTPTSLIGKPTKQTPRRLDMELSHSQPLLSLGHHHANKNRHMNMSDRAGEINLDPLNSPSVANRSEAN